MIAFDCKCDDKEIQWYVKSLDKIYPKHLVQLNYQISEDDPDTAEVDTTIDGWPVRRFKRGKF